MSRARMTEEELALVTWALRPVRDDDPAFRPHHDAHPWVARTERLEAEIRRSLASEARLLEAAKVALGALRSWNRTANAVFENYDSSPEVRGLIEAIAAADRKAKP